MTKILLVEDDKALREIYGVRLLAEGYDIVSAGDGEEALAVAIREKPILIISDVMMPKISGFEMLDLLRSNEATKDIKVIMMTALSGDQHRERSDSLGADRYLVKSQVGIEDVVNTVHEVLGDRGSTAEAAPQAAAPPPAAPAPNQSPVNPPAATAPATTAGVPAPTLPTTPPSVPVVTTPDVPAPVAPPDPATPTPAITPIADTPTIPAPATPPPDLPPVAPPADTAPPQQPPVQSFQPTGGDPDEPEAPYQPSVDLAQSGTHAGARVIQPTGETLTPPVDVQNLIANEEAKDIMDQPQSSDFQSQIATPQTPPPVDAPEIQVDPTGAISIDSLPSTPSEDTATFPKQS